MTPAIVVNAAVGPFGKLAIRHIIHRAATTKGRAIINAVATIIVSTPSRNNRTQVMNKPKNTVPAILAIVELTVETSPRNINAAKMRRIPAPTTARYLPANPE